MAHLAALVTLGLLGPVEGVFDEAALVWGEDGSMALVQFVGVCGDALDEVLIAVSVARRSLITYPF